MKKSKLIVLLLACTLLIVGCESNKTDTKVVSNGEEVNTGAMEHQHCTREGKGNEGVEVSLNYDIYFTGDKLDILVSEEKVMSADSASLDAYEKAYKDIHKHYKGLKYYDTNVVRGDTTVTSTITINYDKVDINKLIDIEGAEDNIFENGEAKVSKWLELAKKFGTKCTSDTEKEKSEA